jgi:hypothetical protein
MGRRRTTGCTARHLPGEPCTVCARLRMRRFRARKPAGGRVGGDLATCGDLATPASTDPERGDAASDEHRRIGKLACAFVHSYLRRGAIVPPTHCERCGAPGAALRPRSERGKPSSEKPPSALRPRTLHPWHPNPGPEPERLREVAWLCTFCRRHVRATREPLVLHWTWPGVPPAPRRPIVLEPAQLAALGAAGQQAAALRERLPGLADELFFSLFREAASLNVEGLYAQGARAAARGVSWQPTGDTELDGLLRRWIAHERAGRAAEAAAGEGRRVDPRDAWVRRPRRDRRSSAPPEAVRPLHEPFDEAAYTARLAAALGHLEDAEALVEATNARVAAALERLGVRPARKPGPAPRTGTTDRDETAN